MFEISVISKHWNNSAFLYLKYSCTSIFMVIERKFSIFIKTFRKLFKWILRIHILRLKILQIVHLKSTDARNLWFYLYILYSIPIDSKFFFKCKGGGTITPSPSSPLASSGLKQHNLNPLPAWGGGQFDPPCSFFLHNSKSIGLRLLKFSDFI